MKTKFVIAATTAMLLTGSAFAQEAGTSPSPTQNAPTATSPSAPTTTPATPEPMEKVAPPAAPAPQAVAPEAPAASKESLDQAQLRKSEDDNKIVSALNASVDKVEDMDVYDANGKKIGEVDSVLEDKDGTIKAVTIEYGGFLGFGEKGAILTLDQIKSKDGKDVMVELTEQDLPSLPAWND
jgi:sporulation protein YlmC with PRC-barrel domain